MKKIIARATVKRIRDLSKKVESIDPEVVAKALGAEDPTYIGERPIHEIGMVPPVFYQGRNRKEQDQSYGSNNN